MHQPFFQHPLLSNFKETVFQRLIKQVFVRQLNIRHIRVDFDRFEAFVAR
jgi:hypothetical protein